MRRSGNPICTLRSPTRRPLASRRPAPFRTAVVAALVIAAVTLVALPAGALGTARTAARRCPVGARTATVEAFSVVFDRARAATVAERAALLEDGTDPALLALLTRWVDDSSGSSALPAHDVRCVSASRARASTDLTLAGVALPKALPRGSSVLEGGTWKVSRTTFCDRMTIENPHLASAGPCAVDPADRSLPIPTSGT